MAQKFHCPKCGTEIPVGQNFCIGCGEKFDYKIAGEEQSLTVLTGAAPPYYSQPSMPVPPPELASSHTGARAFLGAVVAILCIGAVFFLVAIGSDSDGGVSSGGFSFEQLLPGPNLPPPSIKSPPEETPQPENSEESTEGSTESSLYSEDLVITVAKKVSP